MIHITIDFNEVNESIAGVTRVLIQRSFPNNGQMNISTRGGHILFGHIERMLAKIDGISGRLHGVPSTDHSYSSFKKANTSRGESLTCSGTKEHASLQSDSTDTRLLWCTPTVVSQEYYMAWWNGAFSCFVIGFMQVIITCTCKLNLRSDISSSVVPS